MTARVMVLTLGGTIASLPSTSGAGGGAIPTLTGDDLLAMAPGLDQVADVTARTIMQVPSCDIRPQDVRAVAETIAVATAAPARDGTEEAPVDGVVVVQGTDTLEETAYLLDLLLDIEQPVVVTGAMRTPSTPGADGPANLIAAVQVAADPAARGLGALVVLSDEIHAAAHVAKTHSSATDAFTSPGFGPIGRVVEGRVHISARPVRQHEPVDVPPDATWPYVPILRVAQGTRPVDSQCPQPVPDPVGSSQPIVRRIVAHSPTIHMCIDEPSPPDLRSPYRGVWSWIGTMRHWPWPGSSAAPSRSSTASSPSG